MTKMTGYTDGTKDKFMNGKRIEEEVMRTQADHWNELQKMREDGLITDSEYQEYADNISNRVYENDPRSMNEIFSADKAQEVWEAKQQEALKEQRLSEIHENYTEPQMEKLDEQRAELKEMLDNGEITQEEYGHHMNTVNKNVFEDVDQMREYVSTHPVTPESPSVETSDTSASTEGAPVKEPLEADADDHYHADTETVRIDENTSYSRTEMSGTSGEVREHRQNLRDELSELRDNGTIDADEYGSRMNDINHGRYDGFENLNEAMEDIPTPATEQEMAAPEVSPMEPHVESHTEVFHEDGITVEHTSTQMNGYDKRGAMHDELDRKLEAGEITAEQRAELGAEVNKGSFDRYGSIDEAMQAGHDQATEHQAETVVQDSPAPEPHVENATMETVDLGNGETATKVSGTIHGGPEMTSERQAQMDEITQQFKDGEINGSEYQNQKRRMEAQWRSEDVRSAAGAQDVPAQEPHAPESPSMETSSPDIDSPVQDTAPAEPYVENAKMETIELGDGSTMTKTSGVVHGGSEMTPERQAQMDELSQKLQSGEISGREYQNQKRRMEAEWRSEDVREAAGKQSTPSTAEPAAAEQAEAPSVTERLPEEPVVENAKVETVQLENGATVTRTSGVIHGGPEMTQERQAQLDSLNDQLRNGEINGREYQNQKRRMEAEWRSEDVKNAAAGQDSPAHESNAPESPSMETSSPDIDSPIQESAPTGPRVENVKVESIELGNGTTVTKTNGVIHGGPEMTPERIAEQESLLNDLQSGKINGTQYQIQQNRMESRWMAEDLRAAAEEAEAVHQEDIKESQQEVWEAQDERWQNAEKMEAAHQEDIRESREDVWNAQDQHWEERGYGQDGPRTMEAPVEPEIEPAANYTPQTVHVETVDGMSGDFHIDAHGNIQVFGDSIQGAPGLSSAEHVEAFMAEPSVQNAMLKAESTGTMLRSNVNGLELTRDFTINTPEGPMRAQMTMDMQGHADITFPDRSFDTFEDYSKAEAEAFRSPEAQSIQGNMENCRNVLNNQFTAIENRISNLEGLDMTPSETLGRMETEAFTIEQPNGRLSFHSIDAADMMDANEALLNMPEADLTNSLNTLGQENPEVANWLSELFSTPGMKIALLVGLAAIVALVAMSIVKANRLAEEQRLAEAQQERQETVAKELGDAKSNPDGHEKEAGKTAAMARSAADHEENRESAGMKQPDSGEADTDSSSQKNENVAPAMEETIETPDKQQDIPEQEQAKAAPDNKENISSSSVSSKDAGKEEKSEESDKEKPETGKDETEAEEEKAQRATENSIAENIAKGAEAEPQNAPESTSHASDEKEKEAKDENPAKEQPEMHTADTTTPDIADAEDSKGIDETVTDTEKAASDVKKTIDGEKAEEAKDGDSHDKKEPAGTKEAQEKIKENPVRKDSMHEESVKDKEDKDETVHDAPEAEPQVHDDTVIPESPDTPDPVVIPTPEAVTEPAAEKHENALISWEIDKNSGSLILGGDITKKGLERVLAEAEKDALANGYRIDNLVIGNETTSIQPCALTALEGRSPDSKVSPMNLVLEIDKAHKDAYRSIEACKAFIIPESLVNVAIKNYAPDACLSIKDDKTFRPFHTVLTQNVDYIPDNFMGYAKIDQLLQRDTDPDHRMSIGRNAFGQEGPEAERILKTKDPVGHAPNEKTDEKTEHEKMDEHLQPLGHKLSNEHGGWMMDEKASRESLEKLNASMERDNTNRIAALTQARNELLKKRDELVASAKNSPKWILRQYKETEEYAQKIDDLKRNGKIDNNGKTLSLLNWSSGQCGGCDVWDKKIVEMQKKADKLIERYEKLKLPELDGVIKELKDLKNRDFKAERVKLVNEFLQPYLDAVVCSEYMKTPEFAEKMQTFDNKELIKGYKELTEAIGKMDAEIAELGGKHQEILSAEDMQHVQNARDNNEMLVGISASSLGDSAFENQALRFIPGEDAKTYIRHLEKSIPEMDPENQKLAREMIDNVRRGKVFTVPNGVKLGAYALANTNSEGLAEDVNNHISLNAIEKKYNAEIERLKANREELVSKGQDTTQVDKQIKEKEAEYSSRRASMLSEDASDRAVIHDNAVVNNDRAYLFDVKCNDEKMQKMTANCGKEIPEKGMMANISGKSPKKHKAADLDKEKRDYEKKERRDARGMAVLGGLGGAISGMADKDFSATKGLAYAIGTPLFFLALLIGKLGKKGIDCLKEMKNGKQPDLIKMYGLDGNTPETLKLAGRARYELASAVAIAAEKGPGEGLLADLKNISEHLDPDRPEASSLISGSKDAQKLAVALVNSDYSLEELGRLAIEFGSMQDGEHRAEEAKNLMEGLEKKMAEKEVQIKASSKEVGEKSLYNQNSRKIEDSFDKALAKKEKEAEKILRENGRNASGKKLTKTEKIKMKAEDKARNNARKPGKGHTQEQ